MGSVSSTNPATNAGLSDLLQTLTSENSPLLSTFSSPAVESALEKAPAGDIVQLSAEALQLQVTDALFGQPGGSTTPSDNLFSVLSAIDSSATSSTRGSSTGSSLADQLAAFQGNSQLQETQSLLGITPQTTTNPSSSLFNVLA